MNKFGLAVALVFLAGPALAGSYGNTSNRSVVIQTGVVNTYIGVQGGKNAKIVLPDLKKIDVDVGGKTVGVSTGGGGVGNVEGGGHGH